MRSLKPNKHSPIDGSGRTTVAEIRHDCLTDIGRQRKMLKLVSLTPHNDCARTPIDVFKPERGYFTGTQSQPNEHLDDGETPPPKARATVTAT
jgi:hypothetical protein